MNDKDKAMTCGVGAIFFFLSLVVILTGNGFGLEWLLVLPFLLFGVFILTCMAIFFLGRSCK